MSLLSAAAHDEDGDIIQALRAENDALKTKLMAATKSALDHVQRNRDLEALLEAVGAGGIGPLIPATVQHQHKLSNDNDLQRENGHLSTTSSSVPAGWRLVPVEPTEKMVDMGRGLSSFPDGVYRAMLDAAPQPPEVEQSPERVTKDMWKNAAMAALELASVQVQPQGGQEPVSWIENFGGSVSYGPIHEAARKLPEGVRFDLYTRPQPRKPLNKDVIRELLMLKGFTIKDGEPDLRPYVYHAIYAILRAHGIGGEA